MWHDRQLRGSVALRNRCIRSGGEYSLPDGIEVVAEVSRDAELPLQKFLHQLDAHEDAPCIVETLKAYYGEVSSGNYLREIAPLRESGVWYRKSLPGAASPNLTAPALL